MKAQRITIRRVNQQHAQLPEDTVGRTLLLMRIAKSRNGYVMQHQLFDHLPAYPRQDVNGWTHYAILPGYLIP